MRSVQRLPAHKLRAAMKPELVPWKSSADIPFETLTRDGARVFQPRAMRALSLAAKIKAYGYHVYLSGDPDLGRERFLLNWLRPLAAKESAPPDLLYVRNFANPDEPSLISLPAGEGSRFRDEIASLIDAVRSRLKQILQENGYAQRRINQLKTFSERKTDLAERMEKLAWAGGYELEFDEEGGLRVAPRKSGARKTRDKTAKSGNDPLAEELCSLMSQINNLEDKLAEDENKLREQAMVETAASLIDPLERKWLDAFPSENLRAYLRGLRADLVKNVGDFFPGGENDDELPREDAERQYRANLFVDNSGLVGCPVIIEDNPSIGNLLGRVERESEMGALVTDHTLIRAGSLQRANGGYLVLRAEDLIRYPIAWEGLALALLSGEARIEDNSDLNDFTIAAKSLRPEAAPLSVKVILIGDEYFYETLLENEERFGKLFKIKAHMADQADRVPDNIRYFLAEIASMLAEDKLLPFRADALAELVETASWLCEDQRKLSLKFPLLRDTLIEADALARARNLAEADAVAIKDARSEKMYRSNLLQEIFMEDYSRETIKLPTSGEAVGQVNGLSIVASGDYEFGLPQKISCSVGVGHDGIIDLEREADLGGPIHTKAIMILKSYLTELFARKKPLVLSASIYFEQSYAGVEGDSASGAELAALISALAGVPVRLDLAFTGAVSHSGQILAVGGVSQKIEGFYRLCKNRGLTGAQGVLIPESNVECLALDPEILESVEKDEFRVYPVSNMEEALYLLTGLRIGNRRKDGSFTPGSLYDLVDKRLDALGCCAQNAFRRQRKE